MGAGHLPALLQQAVQLGPRGEGDAGPAVAAPGELQLRRAHLSEQRHQRGHVLPLAADLGVGANLPELRWAGPPEQLLELPVDRLGGSLPVLRLLRGQVGPHSHEVDEGG